VKCRNGRIKNAVEREWATLQEVLTNFFYPIVASPRFERKAQEWLADTKWVSWDTSELKIVDNLVIGFMQMHAKPRTKK
jgi:hypothetical protein